MKKDLQSPKVLAGSKLRKFSNKNILPFMKKEEKRAEPNVQRAKLRVLCELYSGTDNQPRNYCNLCDWISKMLWTRNPLVSTIPHLLSPGLNGECFIGLSSGLPSTLGMWGKGQILLFSLTGWEKFEKLYLWNYTWAASIYLKPSWMRFWTMWWYHNGMKPAGALKVSESILHVATVVASLQWSPTHGIHSLVWSFLHFTRLGNS